METEEKKWKTIREAPVKRSCFLHGDHTEEECPRCDPLTERLKNHAKLLAGKFGDHSDLVNDLRQASAMINTLRIGLSRHHEFFGTVCPVCDPSVRINGNPVAAPR